jgi:hypothetical protein
MSLLTVGHHKGVNMKVSKVPNRSGKKAQARQTGSERLNTQNKAEPSLFCGSKKEQDNSARCGLVAHELTRGSVQQ